MNLRRRASDWPAEETPPTVRSFEQVAPLPEPPEGHVVFRLVCPHEAPKFPIVRVVLVAAAVSLALRVLLG